MSSKWEHPRVTVVTSTLNAATTIERAINSVREQDYPWIEYIVIDGVSTDGTIDILKKHEGVVTSWVSEKDSGIYDAWNKALLIATGEWICFLGADDYFADSGAVSRMVAGAVAGSGESLVVYSRIRLVDTEGNFLYETGSPWPETAKHFRQVMNIPHPGLLHHRSLFKTYGNFDPTYRIAGDYEFLLRHLTRHDALFVDGPPVVVMATGGISGTPGQSIRALKEIRHAQKRHGLSLPGFRWIVAMFRVYVRQFLAIFVSEQKMKEIIAMNRRFNSQS